MYGQPGKKLAFMGGEFSQWAEWNHEASLDWHLLEHDRHRGLKLEDLNRFYRSELALFENASSPAGFQWIDCTDSESSVVALIRQGKDDGAVVLAAFSATPVPRHNYRLGAPRRGVWNEALNSDATVYGGSGQGNFGAVETSSGSGARPRAIVELGAAAALRLVSDLGSRPTVRADALGAVPDDGDLCRFSVWAPHDGTSVSSSRDLSPLSHRKFSLCSP